MALKAIQTMNPEQSKALIRENRNGNKQQKTNGTANNNTPSFTGGGGIAGAVLDAPVVVANAITNGGFAFSFIAQDFFGMAMPRVLEGINRRPVNPETGKKEGPYNGTFARREGIREILSGPSAFIIPMGILGVVKKFSGTANNVPVSMIRVLGSNMSEYAQNVDNSVLTDKVQAKRGFYHKVFDNMLRTTLGENTLPPEKLEETLNSFVDKAIEIENAKPHKKSMLKKIANIKVEGSPEDLTETFLQDIMKLKKKYLPASVNETTVSIAYAGDNAGKSETLGFKKLLSTLTDFSDDVIASSKDKIKHMGNDFDAGKFVESFVNRRTGSRIATNVGMWLSVVGFYALIPKLYSLGLKGKNPAFATEEKMNNTVNEPDKKKAVAQKDDNKKTKDVPFCGRERLFTSIADKVASSPKLSNILDKLEFNGASMSVTGMLTLLFGFCLPTRLLNAPDKYDRNETLARDIPSFISILFVAQGISRGFSKLFSKISGLALNITPEDHNKNLWTRFRDYFSPASGINVLDNNQLNSKYTNIHEYKDGINGFFDFISENGGNVKKLLHLDKQVEEQAKIIVGKDIKDATVDEIKEAFRNNNSDDAKAAKKVIEDIFKDSKNKFVKYAKRYNSTFTFLSTIVLVPAFMVWLARTCDRMTRNARARDNALKAQQNAPTEQKEVDKLNITSTAIPNTFKPSMNGFLNK